MRTKIAIGLVGVALAAVLAPRPVGASSSNQLVGMVEIDGSPLRIQVFSDGGLQVFHRDYTHGATFGQGASGGFLAIGSAVYGPDVSLGPSVTNTAPVGNEGPLGRGTDSDPFRLVNTQRVVGSGADLEVVQTVSYVNGDSRFQLEWAIINNGIQPTCFKFYHAADLYFADSDFGYGYYDPRSGAVGGFNEQRDWFMVFIPTVVADHYQETHYSAIWDIISAGQDFHDTISSGYEDNGAGLQWNICLSPGEATTLGDQWSFGTSESQAVSAVSGGFRATGPLASELTTYIPTPLDVSVDPGVIGTNLLLAALAMIPFTAASGLLTKLLVENQEIVVRRLHVVRWIATFQGRLGAALGTRLARPSLAGAARLIGIVLFYGLVFSLLDRSWNPFSLAGLWLFLSMTIAYGVVGIAADIVQWLAARRWGLPADLTLRPTSVILAILSTAASRLFGLVPGLMFGTPDAFEVDPAALDRKREVRLLAVAAGTLVVIGLGAWVPTLATALLRRMHLPEVVLALVGGVESFLLVIFAVTVENGFVQMLPLPGNVGQALRRWNRWIWAGGLMGVVFVFFHILLNPRGDLSAALQEANIRFFIVTVAIFTAGVGLLWLYFRRLGDRAVTSGGPAAPSPASVGEAVAAPEQMSAEPREQPVTVPPGAAATAELAAPAVEPTPPATPALVVSETPTPAPAATEAAISARILAMRQPDARARESSLREIVSLGEAAVAPLISHLSDPDPYARLMAAAALGKLGAAEAVGPLTQALRDPDEGVRYMAGVALRELAVPRPSAAGEAYPPESAGESERPAVGSPAPLSARRRRRPVVGVLAALAAIGCIGGTVGILMVGASIPRIVGLIQVPSSTPTQVPAPSLTPTSTPRPTPTPDAATPLAASACNGELSFVQGRQPDFEETFWDSEYFQQRWGDLCPGCTVTGGVLSMDISVDQGMTGIVVPVRATDFALQIETTPRVVSDSLAVVVDFRVHEATGYYSLALFPDFDAFVLDVNRPGAEGIITTPLWQSTMADLGEGVQTTVLIIARDDRFSVYLDDALVACLQDPGPLTGATHDIRIITQSGPVHVDVDNLRLWDLAGLGGE